MLPLLIVAQSALAQQITLDEPAMPLGRLLPIVSKTAGVEIVASGNVAKDVVLVRAKHRPLGEILKRIADEDGAEVESTTKGYRIVRTTSSARTEHQAALARRVASLGSSLQAVKSALDQPADERAYRAIYPTVKEERNRAVSWARSGTNSIGVRMPATRAVMRSVTLLPIELLANLQEGDSLAYSNRPTKLQRSLPALDGVLKAFAQEQNAWADAATALGKVEPSQYAEDPFRHADPLERAPTRAVLIVTRTNSADSAFLRLVILDDQGKELALSSFGLASKEAQEGLAELIKPSDNSPVPVSAETKALLEGVPHRDGTGPDSPTSDAVALLSHPEEHDPLSYGATDLVRDLAGDRPLVAVLPDMAWFAGIFTPAPIKRSDRALLGSMIEARDENGWLLVRPREPEKARRDRVDRTVLGRFIRTIVAEKRVPLDAYAEYAWKASNAASDYVGVPMAMLFNDPTFNPDVNWRVLRFYGSLSPADRSTMLLGAVKKWENLSPVQRELAGRIVEKDIVSMQAFGDGIAKSTTLWREPSEIYADGYGTLTVKLGRNEDGPLVCASTSNPAARQWRRVLDAQSAGRTVSQPNGPAFDRFGIARRTTFTLRLSVLPNIQAGANLEDVVPPAGALKPIGELPESIRNDFEKGRQSAN